MQVAGDASIEVELAARNAVTSIALCEDSLPAEGLAAGASTIITAQVMLGWRKLITHLARTYLPLFLQYHVDSCIKCYVAGQSSVPIEEECLCTQGCLHRQKPLRVPIAS